MDLRTGLDDVVRIDASLDSRAITFENSTGGRGLGGTAARGRKGAPNRIVAPGERVVLADIDGPGTVRHFWCTFPPAPPERMRALVLEVFYDGADEPSVSVPLLDFFAVTCGRPTAFTSALTAVQEGRGFNAYFPMPFRRHLRVEVLNASPRPVVLYYQLDLTLGPVPDDAGMLHATFRRENPTTMGRDFTIATGLRGPGRFVGCAVGVRTIDPAFWYGEGEVKIYLDDDADHPTICGTGLEDYVGTAWAMGPHAALYGGAPLEVRAPAGPDGVVESLPRFVGFYRWHVPDPVVFRDRLRVTIQQIGMRAFPAGTEHEIDPYLATNPMAGNGWLPSPPGGPRMALFERRDDYCATAFVACLEPQSVPPVDIAAACADIGRFEFERAHPVESLFG